MIGLPFWLLSGPLLSVTTIPAVTGRYCDIGLMLAGEVAARADGRPPAELERELVHRPSVALQRAFRKCRRPAPEPDLPPPLASAARVRLLLLGTLLA